jgi:hypothetical protein
MQKRKSIVLKVGVLILAGFLVSCAHPSGMNSEQFYTRLFRGDYDEVWLASLKALGDYPLKLSNKDTGKIVTENVNGPYNELLFTHPDMQPLPERYHYSIQMNFAKLPPQAGGAVTRVRVQKNLEKFQDFYTGWVNSFSDGLEEQLLLYRIQHILQMDQRLGE